MTLATTLSRFLPFPGGRLLTRRILVTLGLWLVAIAAPAQTGALDAAKRTDIENLLEITQVLAQARSNMGTVIEQLAQAAPGQQPALSAEQRQVIVRAHQEVFDENLHVFKELMVQLHHKHFSAEEIRQLLVFYRSEVGQRFVAAAPLLGRESMEAGLQFGRIIAPRVQQRIRERLSEPAKAL